MGIPGVCGGCRGTQGESDRVAVLGVRGRVHHGPQFERGLQVAQFFGGCTEALGVVGGFEEAASASARSWLARE